MSHSSVTLSVVIVTYNRNQVLVDTIAYLSPQIESVSGAVELLVVDQTVQHDETTESTLAEWNASRRINWQRLPRPNLTGAMNFGLLHAIGDIVLYIDDDVIPHDGLIRHHMQAHQAKPEAWAVVGQILQPGEQPEALDYQPSGSHLTRYMDFPFRSTHGAYIENAMAGNLSLKRDKAIEIGGFDENFTPPVASRFESEFAKRLLRNGGKIWFEPSASIDHLAASSGGVRSEGSHLNSASPRYGVGDYYFALKQGTKNEAARYWAYRFFREVRTKYHLRNPWYIPVKLLGELRAMKKAWALHKNFPAGKLISARQSHNG